MLYDGASHGLFVHSSGRGRDVILHEAEAEACVDHSQCCVMEHCMTCHCSCTAVAGAGMPDCRQGNTGSVLHTTSVHTMQATTHAVIQGSLATRACNAHHFSARNEATTHAVIQGSLAQEHWQVTLLFVKCLQQESYLVKERTV